MNGGWTVNFRSAMTRNTPQGMWLVATLCFLGIGLQCSAEQKYPDIKAMLAKSYQTNVEFTKQPQNISEFTTEFHSREDQTGYFEILISGMINYMYYYGETNEEVTIINNVCEVQPLRPDVEKGTVYTGSSSILYSLPSEKMEYKAETTVRGIKVSQFSYKDDKGNTFDVYFRAADWVADDNTTAQVPVRVTNTSAKGVQMYDFYNFKPYTKRFGDMALKTGIGCKGKKNPKGKSPPTLPNQISFQYEIYNLKKVGGRPEDALELNKIWFDATNKVAKVELNMRNVQGVTEIHDFNSGVMYKLSKDDSCTIQHVSESQFSVSMAEQGVVAMRSPAQLLALTGDFYYAGQTVMRGVACDIWESVQENVHRSGVVLSRVVTTFYITTLKWHATSYGEDETFVPVYRTMAGATNDIYSAGVWSPDFFQAVSYFDFTEEKTYNQGFLMNMDISDCFVSKTYFEMFLMTDQEVSGTDVWKSYTQLSETLWEKMYTAAEISPLRIPRLQVGLMDNATLHVVGLLLPEPAAITRFVPLRSADPVFPGSSMKHLVKVPSQEECAQECFNDQRCLTFLYCDHECYMAPTTFRAFWGKPITVYSCQQYYKSEANMSLPYKEISAALDSIQAEVKKGLEVEVDGETGTKITYKAVKFNTDASPFNERSKAALYELALPQKTLSLKKETTMKAVPLFTSTEISSVQQCYRNCITESGTQCASFSYCPTTKECRLSSVYIMDDDDHENVEIDSRCNVYIRSYMQFFDKFPGSVSRVGGDESKSGVKTAAECAKTCKHHPLIRCRGFEYCPGSKSCVLHTKHFLDLEPHDIVNNTDACSHYALKFSADYTEGARKELVDPNSRTIDLISLEECAKACSTDPSETCQSFNFCPGSDGPDRKCVLNTLSILDRGADFRDSSACFFYYQQDHVTNFIHHDKYLRSTTPISGYTSHGLAGLLIGMLILGLVLGVLGFGAFTYYKAKKAGDNAGTVRFMRHQNDEAN
ncbi:unnamed protein product [Ixodes persulcatus]